MTTTSRPTITVIYTLDPAYTEPKLVEMLKAWTRLDDRIGRAHIVKGNSYDCVPFDSLEF